MPSITMKFSTFFSHSICVLMLVTLKFISAQSFTCPIKVPMMVSSTDPIYLSKPNVNGARKFMDGIISNWEGPVENVSSPIYNDSGNRIVIGRIAQMDEETSLAAVESAKKAWSNGQGQWPQMPASERVSALENVVKSLKSRREEIVNVLMWEIAKTADDAAAEFGRTYMIVLRSLNS